MIEYSKLKEPFNKIHFRPKTFNNGKVLLLAYVDARDVMKRLDDVVEVENWQCDYKQIKNNLYCGIKIKDVIKWDCGTESNTEAEKGESSDAFKRAAVKWGVGRYLYYLPNIWVEIKQTGMNYINIKDRQGTWHKGYYDNPILPEWAYPKKTKEDNNNE